jgi:phosphatidylglycerol:prolipoprotein diacylglycerol transferase
VHPVLFHIGAVLIPSYGAIAALGVLAALFLAQRTARTAGLNPAQVWNLCVIALFAALVGQRLLLIAMNWSDVRQHPWWVLSLAMIHHPLLGVAGAVVAVGCGAVYARVKGMALSTTADALAAPVALGLVLEQVGALLAGSGYGTEAAVRWAVTYTDPLAARWSGTPLGIALHPVQAYAALGFLTLGILLLVCLPARRQEGDVAGTGLIGIGLVVFITELWRDPEGRGSLLGGVLDGPQAAAVVLVLVGGLVLLERKGLSMKNEAQHD